MIRVIAEQRTVYRSEKGRRKGRFTKRAAYLDAAWEAWRTKHPCTCAREGEATSVCLEHDSIETGRFGEKLDPRGDYRRRVIDRLARWLMWRDKVIESRTVAAIHAARAEVVRGARTRLARMIGGVG